MRTRVFRPSPISRLGRVIWSYQLQSVAFRRGNLTCASGLGRIETHCSVRVEFDTTRAVGTIRITERRRTHRATRVQIPNGLPSPLARASTRNSEGGLRVTSTRPDGVPATGRF